jgi:hypothetical protein
MAQLTAHTSRWPIASFGSVDGADAASAYRVTETKVQKTKSDILLVTASIDNILIGRLQAFRRLT